MMTNWNRLLVVLDQVFGFANRERSTVKKLRQAYDNQTNEHVIWLEYRVRIGNRQISPVQRIGTGQNQMGLMRQLLAQIKRLDQTPGF